MPAAPGIKHVGITIAAVVGAGFFAHAALSLVIPADSVRDQVKAQIRATTGLDPVLNGKVAVSLFPTGSVSFNDVSLADPQAIMPALTAEQLIVRLRFFALLAGKIEIADVTLVRPTIAIAFSPGGSSNWTGHVDTLARVLQPNPGRTASFSEIRIADGTVQLQDDAYKTVETFNNVEFALAWPSISKSFAATGHFIWHGEPVDGTLSLNDFASALAGERSGLKLRLSAAPLKLAFDGNISYRPTLKIEGVLAADADSLRETLGWTAFASSPGGGFGRFALKAHTNVVGGNISLSDVNIELDGNVAEGALSLAGDGHKTLQGTLALEALDLTPYVSTIRLLTGNEWNRRPIALDHLGGLDFDLRLSAAGVKLANAKLGRSAVTINLRSSNLAVAVGESQAFGGIVNGSFGLANSAAGADVKAQLQFSDVDLDQCLSELFGFRRIEGKGTLAFAFDTSGASIYELTEGLNGVATLASQSGAITGVNIEQLLRRLERNPLAGGGDFRNGKTPYDALAINLKFTQGTAHVEDLRVEAPAVRLTLAGSASIPSRDLDLRGTASLQAGSTRNAAQGFELPFLVQGPWSEPLIWPDAQALIRRSGAAAPLLDAVRNRLRREPSGAAADAGAAPAAAASPAPAPPLE